MPKCPACENDVNKLFNHHWFELPDMTKHSKEVCRSCNNALQPCNFYPQADCLDHMLPCWDEQVNFIRNPRTCFDDTILYRTYDIEARPYDDKEGEYYRVVLGFDTIEEAKKYLDKWIDAGDIAEGYWKWDANIIFKEG